MSTAPKLTSNLVLELEDQSRKSGPGPIPLVAVVGPTASGKSSLGAWLARKFEGEVLACDSTQVYRGFDIGTSKPTQEEREVVPHHLLDLVDPGFAFTAGEYRVRAIAVLEDLRQRARLPILTVGTGLYLRALLEAGDHGVGIVPTVPVSRTVAGVAAGRDEILEKAVEIVGGTDPRP